MVSGVAVRVATGGPARFTSIAIETTAATPCIELNGLTGPGLVQPVTRDQRLNSRTRFPLRDAHARLLLHGLGSEERTALRRAAGGDTLRVGEERIALLFAPGAAAPSLPEAVARLQPVDDLLRRPASVRGHNVLEAASRFEGYASSYDPAVQAAAWEALAWSFHAFEPGLHANVKAEAERARTDLAERPGRAHALLILAGATPERLLPHIDGAHGPDADLAHVLEPLARWGEHAMLERIVRLAWTCGSPSFVGTALAWGRWNAGDVPRLRSLARAESDAVAAAALRALVGQVSAVPEALHALHREQPVARAAVDLLAAQGDLHVLPALQRRRASSGFARDPIDAAIAAIRSRAHGVQPGQVALAPDRGGVSVVEGRGSVALEEAS